MDKDKALKLALEALKIWEQMYPKSSASAYRAPAITAIEEALAHDDEDAIIIQYHEATIKILEKRIEELTAQPVQEPVAWVWKDMRGQDIVSLFEPRFNSVPLYTTPPQRPWVGLTEDEISSCDPSEEIWDLFEIARKLEAKLKEKNTCQE